MKLTAREYISKAEGLKQSELNVRARLERIKADRIRVQNAIETQNYRLQSLMVELDFVRQHGDMDDAETRATYDKLRAAVRETENVINELRSEDNELASQQREATAELERIEREEQSTLDDIQDSATRASKNIALISSFGGDYGNVAANAANQFQVSLNQLGAAASILGGSVPAAAWGSAGYAGGSARSNRSGSGSLLNFFDVANNQRNADKHGSLGARPGLIDSSQALDDLAAYMAKMGYGPGDYALFINDPVWRALHKAAYPDDEMLAMSPEDAVELLAQYMEEHGYGPDDYDVFSKDPVWQELQKYAFPDKYAGLIEKRVGKTSVQHTSMINVLEGSHVAHRRIEMCDHPRTQEQIIADLGGGDETKGSCSSLAFAYIGCKEGYDVHDFRDGLSRNFFSMDQNIQKVANLPGVESHVINGRNDFECAQKLFTRMEPGKDYYFACGQHAAIVRNNNGRVEYLELQSHDPKRNGWHSLDSRELECRFGASVHKGFECGNFLIETSSLGRSKEFIDVLGYINTSESRQRKGVHGDVK